MRKTKKILEVEQKFGSDLGDLLKKLYVDEEKPSTKIAEMFGVSDVSVGNYLRKCGIPIRTFLEIQLHGRQKPSKEQLIQLYILEHKTVGEISEMFGFSGGSIVRWLRNYSISTRNNSEVQLKGKQKLSEDQLRQLYMDEKKSTVAIAKMFGINSGTVGRWLREYKITARKDSEAQLKGKQKPSKEQLIQLYVTERKTTYEIGELFGITPSTICDYLRDCKISVRTLSEIHLDGKQKPSKEQLIQLYVVEGKSAVKIGNLFGIESSTVGNYLRNYKIPIRNQDSSNELKRQALERVLEAYLK